jgi:hypothetical protein
VLVNGRQGYAAAGTGPLAGDIAGVVDGALTVSVNPDESMCLHISLAGRPDVSVEIILVPEQAHALFGASARQSWAEAPCQVGVQLGARAV